MFISRKVTKDKRDTTDLRHLNVTIAKNNLAYPLLKDKFSVLGSSRCEVISILYFKDAILPYFGSTSYLYQRMIMGLNISPSIWQLYINIILDCLQRRKYCKAIMDDLLLFTPMKKSHIAKLDDLLKVLLENGLKISPKKSQLFRKESQYMGNTTFQDRRGCVKWYKVG